MPHASLVRVFAIAAALLCLVVVVLGAYVRLSDAGLGCPDWPGCYGHLTPAAAVADVRTAAIPLGGRSLDVGKAWREMTHRYAAGTLGLMIVALAGVGIAGRRARVVPSMLLLALPMVVVLQAVLGMLTVTQQLRPVIVTLHLLFGFTTLSLLWWLVFTLQLRPAAAGPVAMRRLALIALVVLCLQIAVGAWTSSNYAAIACPDLPTCQGAWWPYADFRSGFVLWRSVGINYEGGVLANAARVAIHLTHRIGALIASLVVLVAAIAALQTGIDRSTRRAGAYVLAALALQLSIGVLMVLRGFPLGLATAHNAGAALVLLAVLALNRSLHPVKVTFP